MSCRIIKSLIIAAFSAFMLSSPLFSHFEDTALGVRPAGFAGAYTAGSASVESLHYNPGALAFLSRPEASTSFSRFFTGLTEGSSLGEGFVGAAMPLGSRYGIGAGWHNFSLAGYYSENTFYLGFASQLSAKLYGGVTLKLLKKAYEQTDYTENSVDLETGQVEDSVNPVFEDGYSVTGFTPDIGIMYEFSPEFSAGAALSNTFQPDMALWDEDTDRVPFTAKLGIRYEKNEIKMLADTSWRDEDLSFSLGAGRDFGDLASLRAGLGLGSRQYREIAVGASLNNEDVFHIDYAFSYPLTGIGGTYGTHRLGFSLKFGGITLREITPEDRAEARRLMGEAETFMDRGDFDEALGLLSRARRLDRELQEVNEKRAEAKRLRSEKRDLEKDLRRQYLKGVNKLNRDDFQEALEYFRSVMEADDRGWQEIIRIKERAEEKMDQLSHRKSEYVDSLIEQAEGLVENSKYEEARNLLNLSLSLEKREQAQQMLLRVRLKLIGEYYTEGINLFINEKYSDAIEFFKKIIEIDKQHEQALEMIERIREIQRQ